MSRNPRSHVHESKQFYRECASKCITKNKIDISEKEFRNGILQIEEILSKLVGGKI